MSTPTAPPRAPAPAPDPHAEPGPARPSSARLALGGLLVLFGLAWLAEATGLFTVRWQTVLSAALIGIGAILLATSRRGGSDGLIGLGVVLSVVLLFLSTFPGLTPRAGMGDRLHQPADVSELQDRYELGAGELVVDLRALELPAGRTEVTAEVGMGELVVRVPGDVAVEVDASAGMGDVDVLGRRSNGVGPTVAHAEPGEGTARLVLELSTGMGSIEVTR